MKPVHALIAVPFLGILALNLVERQRHQEAMAQVRSELGSLRTSVDDARDSARTELRARALPALHPAAPAPRDHAPAEEPEAAEAEPAAPPPPPPEVAEVRLQLDQQFTDERIDPEWQAGAQQRAQEKLAQALPETSSLRSLECRASMCRFKTVHEGLGSYHHFVQEAFINPETRVWNGGFFTALLEDPVDGKHHVVSYLAREGEELAPIQRLQ